LFVVTSALDVYGFTVRIYLYRDRIKYYGSRCVLKLLNGVTVDAYDSANHSQKDAEADIHLGTHDLLLSLDINVTNSCSSRIHIYPLINILWSSL